MIPYKYEECPECGIPWAGQSEYDMQICRACPPKKTSQSGWDIAKKLAALAQHAKDCLSHNPLPTGDGYWHCSCGLDALVLDGELLDIPVPAVSVSVAPAQPAGIHVPVPGGTDIAARLLADSNRLMDAGYIMCAENNREAVAEIRRLFEARGQEAMTITLESTLPDWPECWLAEGWNCCMPTAAQALRYLAENKRPSGGQDRFNAEHLYDIAIALEKTQRELIGHGTAAPASPAADERVRELERLARELAQELKSLHTLRAIDVSTGYNRSKRWELVTLLIIEADAALTARKADDKGGA